MFRNTQTVKNVANLTLNSRDISPNDNNWYRFGDYVDNNIGYIFPMQNGATWKNINLENLVGKDIYNKYNVFRLQLCQFIFNTEPSIPGGAMYTTDPIFRNMNMYIYGPPWKDGEYNTGTMSKNTVAHFTNITEQINVITAQTGNGGTVVGDTEYLYDINNYGEGMSRLFNKVRSFDITMRYGPMSADTSDGNRYSMLSDTTQNQYYYDVWLGGKGFCLKFNVTPVE